MTTPSPTLGVRSLQYRDLDYIKQWRSEDLESGNGYHELTLAIAVWADYQRRWYAPLKLMRWFPRPLTQSSSIFVAERQNVLLGFIQVTPFNRSLSTWQVEQVVINRAVIAAEAPGSGFIEVGSKLLRHCFEAVWEARNWVLEVDVTDKAALGLYRFNGFQPLAQTTYWSLMPDQIVGLADREPDLPNLLPISNADAQLLYQLNTAAMPPLVRQVFDHQIQDFQSNLMATVSVTLDRLVNHVETISAYVFEQQRKAAIGQFKLSICRDGSQPHQADLTVHPAYTWLYPELMVQMARILQPFPPQCLRLTSLDYQPEREAYLTQIQAKPESHTLLMSRSVWHKVREAKPVSLEGLQLSDVFTGLQPTGKPIPGRIARLSKPWSSRWDTCQGKTKDGDRNAPIRAEALGYSSPRCLQGDRG
jgi:ribosomal protein S18 acetylase RimI-like enzyme